MSISKEYWENPDNPTDNGYAHICNICGEHGHSQGWADGHLCETKRLADMEFWKNFYAPTGTCTRCGVAEKFDAKELTEAEHLCPECYDIVYPLIM